MRGRLTSQNELELFINALMQDLGGYIRANCSNPFEEVPVPENQGDKEQVITYVRSVSQRMPGYVQQEETLTVEYFENKPEIPDAIKSRFLTEVMLSSDVRWLGTMKRMLENVGATPEEIDSIVQEYDSLMDNI